MNEFELLVDKSLEYKQYVGLGNPDSKILFIGKEVGLDREKDVTNGSAQSWKNGSDFSNRFSPDNPKIRDGKHTWQKYQKLYDKIIEKLKLDTAKFVENKKYDITFVENVFTTELNNLHAPNSSEAKKHKDFKSNLKLRKEVFFRSCFIQNFPIVVIFANDNNYIETHKGEVIELFGVEFSNVLHIGNNEKIWVHYAINKAVVYPKIVIHTRQLTNGASDKLIEIIAQKVFEFITENDINIIVKKYGW
jgi:hypothetical protein